jgi:hypothetical protein
VWSFSFLVDCLHFLWNGKFMDVCPRYLPSIIFLKVRGYLLGFGMGCWGNTYTCIHTNCPNHIHVCRKECWVLYFCHLLNFIIFKDFYNVRLSQRCHRVWLERPEPWWKPTHFPQFCFFLSSLQRKTRDNDQLSSKLFDLLSFFMFKIFCGFLEKP